MAICFFTAKYVDGSGDIVQTVKIADFVKKLAESRGYLDDIIIIVPDTQSPDHKAITQCFLDDINPTVHVLTISEFSKRSPNITCCIQAGYSTFNWKEKLGELITKDTPIIYMPEYDNDLYPLGATKILGGFNTEKGDVGVIPSQYLLDATITEAIPHEKIQHAFEQLDPKIKQYLHQDSETYINYRDSHELSFQYSHDRNTYPTYYGDNNVKGGFYTPIKFFLQEHIMLVSHSIRSQDVFCLGDRAVTKKDALLQLKDTLIRNKYTKIVFVNIDEETEEVLYQSPTSTSTKEYRVLYSKSVPFSTMQVLPLLANDFVGATGDNSLVEAMSARKLVSYECINHKVKFVDGYLSALYKETNNEQVLLLAKFLMKKAGRCSYVEYNESEISKLLVNKQVVDELKNINRNLVAGSQYFKYLDEIISSICFKGTLMAEQSLSKTQTEETDAAAIPSVAIESLPVDLTGQMLIEFERNSANKATLGFRAAVQAGREEPNPSSAPTHRT